MDKKVGDITEAEAPGGKIKFKISRSNKNKKNNSRSNLFGTGFY
jgi:hypothetical protein